MMIQLLNNRFSDQGIILLRVWLGIIMIKYSFPVVQNNTFMDFGNWLGSMEIPFPHIMAYLSKGGEFLAGILLTAGLFTRVGTVIIFINMLVAILVVNGSAIFSKGELPFGYLLIALVIFLQGPGKWSVDHWLLKIKK